MNGSVINNASIVANSSTTSSTKSDLAHAKDNTSQNLIIQNPVLINTVQQQQQQQPQHQTQLQPPPAVTPITMQNMGLTVPNNSTTVHQQQQVQSNTATTYFQPHNTQHLVPYNTSNYCFMCRQDFLSRSEFMVHIRSHFVDGKMGVGDMSAADMLARTLMDNTNQGLCT